MTKVSTEPILGFFVINNSAAVCLESIVEWIRKGDHCKSLACINPHSYYVSLLNGDFYVALHESDWLIPDGTGIAMASRFLQGSIRARVTGSDIFKGVHERLDKSGGASVFFLGSTRETLGKISRKMSVDFPNVRIAGLYSPPFKLEFSIEDTQKMLNAINRAAPDVLWVGMTSPKQDLWIYQNKHLLNVKFAAGIGAVFDFYSGRVVRSHPIFQKMGLEWLPRLLQEPRRLWRRMFISAPVFLWHVILQRIGTNRFRNR